ncbi:hypothetical protein GCM10022262_21950 [Georgenia daeguensis]|uniref:Flp pilus-assembly TadG-like N-terminal domain-containing protein n=2 Tax=Georgenia daeguensis TaxID=908355 RepID=A0ABP8EVD4_9MICO
MTALRRRMAAAGAGEEGQIMLLSLAFGVLVLALVLVVASASAVHIERKRLLALADGAAADAADAIDVATYYGAPAGPVDGATRVPLSDASVDAAVREYLGAAPAAVVGEFDGLRVAEPTGTPDGTTAQVTLAATARPPLVPWVLVPWSDGIALRVTSTARAG